VKAKLALTLAAVGFGLGMCVTGGAALPSSGHHPKAVCGTAANPPTSYRHVVWIVMENKQYDQVIGSADAPYINALAGQCGLATNFDAEAHPSLPNYVAMTSGSTQGITDDKTPAVHPLTAASIFSQLGTGNWRALEESMPSDCALADSGDYVVHHNPAAYYTTIRPDCQTQDVPLGRQPDISARFTFITPNNCHNMHSCPVSSGDAWLSSFLPQILTSRTYTSGDTAIFLTWDEAKKSAATNHIPTIVIAPSIPTGTQSATAFTHYSMLRTTEELLGLPLLGNATTASSMRPGFHL
jgi:hypothetical protein